MKLYKTCILLLLFSCSDSESENVVDCKEIIDPFIQNADSVYHFKLSKNIKDSIYKMDSVSKPYCNVDLIKSRGKLKKYTSNIESIINNFKVCETQYIMGHPCDPIFDEALIIFSKTEKMEIYFDHVCKKIRASKIFEGQKYFGQNGEFERLKESLRNI